MITMSETTKALEYRLLSKRDVARMLGYTTKTIDRMVQANKIPHVLIPNEVGSGTRVRFDSRQINAWLEANTHIAEAG